MNRLQKIALLTVTCGFISSQTFAQNNSTHNRPGGQNTSISRTMPPRPVAVPIPLSQLAATSTSPMSAVRRVRLT